MEVMGTTKHSLIGFKAYAVSEIEQVPGVVSRTVNLKLEKL